MPGLDVLRGLAILLVILYHAAATISLATLQQSPWLQEVMHPFALGAFGVHLFFVLSGFLITGILLDARDKRSYYKDFYFRRVLRILPAYLLMIAVLKLSSAITWRYVAVCLLYLCNMSGLLHARNEYGPLWSLSVEEQFYLVLPVVVRHLRRSRLVLLAWVVVAAAPVLRFGLQFAPVFLSDIRYKTWDVADFFAGGILLAAHVRRESETAKLRQTAWLLLGCGTASIAVWQMAGHADTSLMRAMELTPLVPLFSGLLLILYCYPEVIHFWAGRILALLGEISYGLYLVHQFIFNQVQKLGSGYERQHPVGGTLACIALELSIAIAIAFVSRRSFEAWFLRMKPRAASAVLPESPGEGW